MPPYSGLNNFKNYNPENEYRHLHHRKNNKYTNALLQVDKDDIRFIEEANKVVFCSFGALNTVIKRFSF